MPSVTSRLKKNISRTKEKILQGIGKTDKTEDEIFDLYVENFDRQHSQANKLSKELNRYLTQLKETQKASKNFYDTLRETYETSWPEQAEFNEQADTVEDKWDNYLGKLVNEVQQPLVSYLNEFPELKKKIEKRHNRLLDFDNARHTLEAANHKSNKRTSTGGNTNNSTLNQAQQNVSGSNGTSGSSNGSNSAPGAPVTMAPMTSHEQLTKLTKLKIDLEDKQHVYEEINQTLCMTLPVLYENRIMFYSSLLQTFFHTETNFHSDCLEITSKLDTLCESLSTQSKTQVSNSELYYAKVNQNQSNSSGGAPEPHGFQEEYGENSSQNVSLSEAATLNKRSIHVPSNIGYIEASSSSEFCQEEASPPPAQQPTKATAESDPPTPIEYDSSQLESIEKFLDKSLKHLDLSPILNKEPSFRLDRPQDVVQAPAKASPEQSLARVQKNTLYKVKATYAYQAKEIDELTFVKEDIIKVVEGTESECEDLDEGWLIGIHEPSLKRGLFPANFTKRL